jgi:cytochrome P450
MISSSLADVALDAPEFYAGQPWSAYRTLRDEAPVYWYEPGKFWAISRHADVTEVSRAPERFSSALGVTINDVVHPERRLARELGGGDAELLLSTDPPRHRDLRKVLAHHFTNEAVRRLEERIREVVRRNLEEAAEAGVANYADMVSIRTAIQTICIGLDLPTSDWEMLKALSATQTAGFDAADEEEFELANKGMAELRDYFAAALADRKRNPRGEDDWMTTLVGAHANGEPVSLDTQLLFCIDLLTAGNETTDPLLAGGTLGLWEHPVQKRLLREYPGMMANGVNELLRWVTPVVAAARTAKEDSELHGQTIEAGEHLILLYGAANHDERSWGPNAGEIDVEREKLGRQLAFGTGIHVCIGAHLARLEAKILFEELLRSFPDYQVVGEPTRVRSTIVNALSDLPVSLRG